MIQKAEQTPNPLRRPRSFRPRRTAVRRQKRLSLAPAALLVVNAFGVALAAAQQPTSLPQEVIATVQARIARSRADVGIVVERLDGSMSWSLRQDQTFHAASTMKVAVMLELFRQAHDGQLKLDNSLPVKNEFHSIVDGSVYRLDPTDDSEKELYQAERQTRTLAQLCELMITASSNLATNLLIEKLGVENIQATVHRFHADGLKVLRGVEDQKAFDRGWNNTTTARGLAALLLALGQGRAVDAEASRQMVAILERQTFNEGIPAGVPAGTRVAHKTGEITKIHHDAAIVFAPKPFVLVILVRGLGDFQQSSALIAELTRAVYPGTQ